MTWKEKVVEVPQALGVEVAVQVPKVRVLRHVQAIGHRPNEKNVMSARALLAVI